MSLNRIWTSGNSPTRYCLVSKELLGSVALIPDTFSVSRAGTFGTRKFEVAAGGMFDDDEAEFSYLEDL